MSFGLGLIFCISLNAAPSRDPGFREFRQYCREHRSKPAHLTLTAPEVGTIDYFPTWALEGSQGRFAWEAFKRKLRKGWEYEASAYVDKKRDKWVFAHHDGRSFYPAKKAIKAVFYNGQLHVVDGHHRALISTYLGAEFIPVQIIDNKSALPLRKFRREMESEKKSFFRDYRGRPVDIVDLCEMEDDPNLELARMLIGRVDVSFENGEMKVENPRGSKWTIGIKTDEDMAYLEFEVADALRRAGIVWENDADYGVSQSNLRKFLEILKVEARKPHSRLKKVLLFDEPSRASRLNLHVILHKHLMKIGCEAAMTVKVKGALDEVQ